MIKLQSRIISTPKRDEFWNIIRKKSIETNDNLNWRSTISMTDNEYDFFSSSKKNSLTLTRIRRIGLMKLLPKVIVEISNTQKNEVKYLIKLSTFTAIICGLAIFLLLLNIYYHFAFGDNSLTDLMQAGVLILVYLGLVYIEVKVTESKFKKYQKVINKSV